MTVNASVSLSLSTDQMFKDVYLTKVKEFNRGTVSQRILVENDDSLGNFTSFLIPR